MHKSASNTDRCTCLKLTSWPVVAPSFRHQQN